MSVIISDTSPLVCLHHLGLKDLLAELFGTVIIPSAVASELAESAAGPIEVGLIPWLVVQDPKDIAPVTSRHPRLDDGEAAAIALAVELGANLLLIDETTGRAAAASWGLKTTGTIGVLLRGKANGRVVELRPLLDRLINELNFFISKNIYEVALRAAGE